MWEAELGKYDNPNPNPNSAILPNSAFQYNNYINPIPNSYISSYNIHAPQNHSSFPNTCNT